MGVKYTNNAKTTISSGINNSVTTIPVASSSGFPSLSGSDYFYATLDDATNLEVVKVTAVSGTNWTVVRAQDDTTARAWSSGDDIELRLNAALLTDVVNDAMSDAFTRQAFTGDGSTTAFTLSKAPATENDLIVFIEGVFQTQSAYSVSGTTLTFSAAPANSREIIVYNITAAVNGDSLSQNNFTGDGSDTTFTLGTDPLHENNTMVFLDGVYQHKSTYSVSGTTLTFSTAPASGVAIECITHTQTEVNTPASNSVVTASIVDDNVTQAKIADDAVGADQLAASAVVTASIVDDNVTQAKIADDAVGADQLASSAVVTASIVDDAVTTAKIADDQVTLAKMAGLARGKIIYGDSSGNPAALALGSNGQVLKSDGTDIAWATDATVAALTSEEVQDIVGAMFSSNTETGITATYQDGDGTVDLVIGTLNQDTTGTAATVTGAAQTNITSLGTLTALTGGTGDLVWDTTTLVVDSSANFVGMGTASPSAALDVVTDNNVWTGEFTQSNTSNGDGVLVSVGSTAAADYALSIRSDAGNTHVLAAKADGKVGIGTASPSYPLSVEVDASATWLSRFYNTGTTESDNGLLVRTGSEHDGTITLGAYSGSSYKFVVLGDGNVGIGESSPLASLHIKQGDSGLSSLNAAAHHLFLEDTGANGPGITFASGTTSNCTLAFGDSDSNYQGFILYDNSADALKFGVAGAGEKLRLQSDGKLLVTEIAHISGTSGNLEIGNGDEKHIMHSDGYHQFQVADTEIARINAEGIAFNGDSAAANSLDDYEEGTWTPTVGGWNNSTVKSTASQNQGHFTKVGNLVTVTANIVWNGTETLSGGIIVRGLPYAAKNVAGYRAGGSIAGFSGLTASGSYTYFTLGIDASQTYFYIINANASGYGHSPTVSNSGAVYGLTFSYQTT